jgi:predicted enzyme related to lactoylglutathione lyase
MFNKIRSVIYHAPNLDEAKEWSKKVIGIAPYFNEPFYVGFDINGFELGLDPDMNKVQNGNNAVAYWAVSEIENVVEKLKHLGAEIDSPVTNVGGGIKAAVIKDPFNNFIGLIEGH